MNHILDGLAICSLVNLVAFCRTSDRPSISHWRLSLELFAGYHQPPYAELKYRRGSTQPCQKCLPLQWPYQTVLDRTMIQIEALERKCADWQKLSRRSTLLPPFMKADTKHCREGLVGNYDYAFLFKPNLPFMKRERRAAPFFGLHDRMPVFLALLLGFQHALAMLAGIITPPIILSSAANLTLEMQQYLVSTSLIVSGILSTIQISRFHFYRTNYYLGTGLISVVGTSFATIPIATGALAQMYQTGFCPVDADGNKLPCPDGYGAILGTQCVCALLEILMSFTPPRILKRIFPPLVTGPTVMLIGVHLIETGFKNWAGGSNDCAGRPETGLFRLCPTINAPHALPWGSAEFIGLGFSVFITIIICERFGAPIMKSTAVVIGLLVGCIIAAACGYFDRSSIDSSPAASFIWVHTFKLSVYGPIVLPLLAVYMVLAMEAMGDITATCDVSRLDVDGELFDSRIQGGILADGLNGTSHSESKTPILLHSQSA